MRHGNRLALVAGLAAGLGGLGIRGEAQTRTWRTATSGVFSTGSNWVGGVAPGSGNTAAFGLTASTTPFTVTFSGPATTAGLTVSNMPPTLSLAGFTYNVTGDSLVGGVNGPTLTLLNGTLNTRAGSGRLFIGQNSGQSGTVVVGPGGVLQGVWEVGSSGTGTLTVQGGGQVAIAPGDRLAIANSAGSTGHVTVSGAGSALSQADGTLVVGSGGTASLSILAGAHVSATRWIVAQSNGTGSLLVSGAGSRFDSPGSDCYLGVDHGTATLTIDQGGAFAITGGFIGSGVTPGSRGDIVVRDPASTYSSPQLRLGDGGSGSLLVEAGGHATCSDSIWVGKSTGGSGSILVRGDGSTLAAEYLQTFEHATGSIRVEQGGHLDVNHDISSWVPGTHQDIVVTGAGSRLSFGIGGGTLNSSDSTLSLQVLQGGLLSGTWLHPGDNPNGTASITVDGPGSAIAVRDFSVGHGTVDVRITDGATATALNGMQVGCCNTTTPKTLLVRGTGSSLVVGDWPNTGGTFNFGFDGTGNTGTVDQGGSITVNNNAYVGQRGAAALSILGEGSSFSTPFELTIGSADTGTHGTFSLADGAAATLGSLHVSGGPAATGTLTADHGSLAGVAHGVWVSEGGAIELLGGSALEINDYINLYGSAAAPAAMRVSGAGSYFYGSGIAIGDWSPGSTGTLTLEDGATVFAANFVETRPLGTLAGTGTISGRMYHSGTLNPGSPLGALDFAEDLRMSGTATTSIQLGGTAPGSFDQLRAQGTLVLDGTLDLALANGFSPLAGQSFDIATSGPGRRFGEFSSVAGTDLGNHLALAVQYLSDRVRLVADAVTALEIDSPSFQVYHGFTEALTATASFASVAAQDVTGGVEWSSDDPDIATVAPDGRVTGHRPGGTTIRARYAGFEDAVPVAVGALPVPDGVDAGLDVEFRRFWCPRFDLLTPAASDIQPTASILHQPDWNRYGPLTVGDTYVAGRMTGTLHAPVAGEYGLKMLDFNAETRVFINGALALYEDDATWYLSEWHSTVSLPAGPSSIVVEYWKQGNYGGYSHELSWTPPGASQPEIIPASAFEPGGVAMQYYLPPQPVRPSNWSEFDPSNYDVFLTDTAPAINFALDEYPNFCARFYGDTSARYSGWIAAPTSGEYTLYAHSFGVFAHVRVNGTDLGAAGDWGRGAALPVTLNAGLNAIEVEGFRPAFNYDEGFRLELAGPGISRQAIPASAFWRGTPVPTCRPDFNGDGFLDFFDYDDYVNCFETGSCPPGTTADFNGDGFADFFDYDDFVAAFEIGC